jgi:hypothetical protein
MQNATRSFSPAQEYVLETDAFRKAFMPELARDVRSSSAPDSLQERMSMNALCAIVDAAAYFLSSSFRTAMPSCRI